MTEQKSSVWHSIGAALVQLGAWCIGHPDQVMAVVLAVQSSKKK